MEGYIIFVIATAIGSLVWGLRLEGEVKTAKQRHDDLKELIEVRFDATDARLERIEKALNGALCKE